MRHRAFLYKANNIAASGGGVSGVKPSKGPQLMNIQMELRKCCNHAFLVEGVEMDQMRKLEQSLGAAAYDQATWDRERVAQGLVLSSGKMVLIDKLLPKLKREGHKVLIFSQMVRMLDVLEEFCHARRYVIVAGF